ncbi:hypothetical protein [Amycolatopsis lurida]|uniref:hypothetical protein n=1 Tax=Amycolatopsis lurida TaxID=31959 RepID=UPI0005AD4BF3|nr:hypothetical protein [Amycolatopsis lurida]
MHPTADVVEDLRACDLLEPAATAQSFDPPVVKTYEVPEAGIGRLSPGQGTKVPSRDAVEIREIAEAAEPKLPRGN